jgi:hypothetical protein
MFCFLQIVVEEVVIETAPVPMPIEPAVASPPGDDVIKPGPEQIDHSNGEWTIKK